MGYFKYLIPVILAMVFWYVFFAIITISTANANTPDWVLGKGHKSFPEIKYLVGVGVSEKSPIMASQSARAELTKSISIKINSFASDFMSREESVSESSITTSTDFILEGSQVKDGWYDNRNDLYYSFVVIERDHVLETLRTTIDTIFLNVESNKWFVASFVVVSFILFINPLINDFHLITFTWSRCARAIRRYKQCLSLIMFLFPLPYIARCFFYIISYF